MTKKLETGKTPTGEAHANAKHPAKKSLQESKALEYSWGCVGRNKERANVWLRCGL